VQKITSRTKILAAKLDSNVVQKVSRPSEIVYL
jgi:hypothetical protein